MPLGRGDPVDGRYRIIERIGDGARAQVYLGGRDLVQPWADVKEDGTFTLARVQPGVYTIQLSGVRTIGNHIIHSLMTTDVGHQGKRISQNKRGMAEIEVPASGFRGLSLFGVR